MSGMPPYNKISVCVSEMSYEENERSCRCKVIHGVQRSDLPSTPLQMAGGSRHGALWAAGSGPGRIHPESELPQIARFKGLCDGNGLAREAPFSACVGWDPTHTVHSDQGPWRRRWGGGLETPLKLSLSCMDGL